MITVIIRNFRPFQGTFRADFGALAGEPATQRIECNRNRGESLAGIQVADLIHPKDAFKQTLGVRMTWVLEYIGYVGDFHYLTGVHDPDPVAHLTDDAQVVGDQ